MPKVILVLFNAFLPVSQVLLIIYGVYLLYNDYIINNEKSVIKLPFFYGVVLYTLYLVILTIFQGTMFATYNNAFFIIHSVLFFLIMLIYCNKYKWIESIVDIALFFVIALSIFSVLTTIIFIVTNTFLLDLISNEKLVSFLVYVAPPGERVLGLMTNENTYSYLLLFTFYIYIFLILYYKRSKVKYVLIVLTIINFFNFFITGSRGAILTLFISGIIFSILLLLLMNNFSYDKFHIVFKLILLLFVVIILFILIVFNTDYEISLKLKDFILENIIRFKNLKFGSGRLYIWQNVLSIDKQNFLFGLNDQNMFELIKDNLPNYSKKLLNNDGRYHNIYLTLLANYGIFALIGFLSFLFYSIVIFIKGYFNSSFKRRRFILFFAAQFIAFLISGIFEQLSLFNLSPHSLLFMFSWASLYGLTYLDKNDYDARI